MLVGLLIVAFIAGAILVPAIWFSIVVFWGDDGSYLDEH